jgi:type I restriction enzyme R subunit
VSEYQFVEKPLLNQLSSMDWTVVEQPAGIPTDPAKSLRSSFREVVIKSEFIKSVNAINLHEGKAWLTPEQLEGLYEDFTNFGVRSLLLKFRSSFGLKITVNHHQILPLVGV